MMGAMHLRARHVTAARRRTAAVRRSVVGGATATAAIVLAASRAVAQDSQTVTDAESSRAILVVVICLVVLGLVLSAITAWFWNTTRPDHPALGPLEVMGDRGFENLSTFEQRQRLDAARPTEADTEHESLGDVAPRAERAVDLQRLVRDTPRSFDDLVDEASPSAIAPSVTSPSPLPPPPVVSDEVTDAQEPAEHATPDQVMSDEDATVVPAEQ